MAPVEDHAMYCEYDMKHSHAAEPGFIKKLMGGGSGPTSPRDALLLETVGKKAGVTASSPKGTSAPRKLMEMISPLFMGNTNSAKTGGVGSGKAVAAVHAVATGVSADLVKLSNGSACSETRPLARTMSANSGLTEYVNKMKISELGGSKRSKVSNESNGSSSSAKSSGSQMSIGSGGTPASTLPPGPPLTSSLDKLLEAARFCNLPQSQAARAASTADADMPDVNAAAAAAVAAAAAAAAAASAAPVLLCLSATMPPRMQRPVWALSDYTIGDKLYTGYASTVYKAICKRSNEVVVLKIYHLSSVCDLYKYQIYREVRVHSNLQHENIVHLYAAFQEGDKVVMVQEYADGADLFNLLYKYGGRLSERLAVQMVLDPFLRVLQYLHTRAIIHRDIKPENIMFTKNMCLKLGDFGLAIDLREERAVTRAGTLDYMAPEVLRCPFKSRPEENKENIRLHYNNRVDAWAVGVLTYELLVGFPPFFDKSRTGTEDRIMSSVPVFPANMSEEAKNFICHALQKEPVDRPTTLEMLHHPWVESYRTRRSMRTVPIPSAAAAAAASSGRSFAAPAPTPSIVAAAAAPTASSPSPSSLHAVPSLTSFGTTTPTYQPQMPMSARPPASPNCNRPHPGFAHAALGVPDSKPAASSAVRSHSSLISSIPRPAQLPLATAISVPTTATSTTSMNPATMPPNLASIFASLTPVKLAPMPSAASASPSGSLSAQHSDEGMQYLPPVKGTHAAQAPAPQVMARSMHMALH